MILKNVIISIIAVVAGLYVGGSFNMDLINISGSIIAPPEGAIMTTTEGLKEALHLFTYAVPNVKYEDEAKTDYQNFFVKRS